MKLSRLGCVSTLLLISASAVPAQEETPKWEIFGGYSFNTYGNVDPGLHGWTASATWNVNRWLGFTADFGGNYAERSGVLPPPSTPLSFTNNHRQHTFLFGPRVSLRKERFTLFAHGLIGLAHTNLRFVVQTTPTPTVGESSDASFSYVLGGGFDLHAGRRVSLRLIQGDYHYTHPFGSGRDSFRIGTGVVLRIGSK